MFTIVISSNKRFLISAIIWTHYGSFLTHICVTRPQWVNSLRPGDAQMCHWTVSSLDHVMACHLFGSKPFPEPITTYCQLLRTKFSDFLSLPNWYLNVSSAKVAAILASHQCVYRRLSAPTKNLNLQCVWIFILIEPPHEILSIRNETIWIDEHIDNCNWHLIFYYLTLRFTQWEVQVICWGIYMQQMPIYTNVICLWRLGPLLWPKLHLHITI